MRNPLTDTPLGMAEECLGESEGEFAKMIDAITGEQD